MTLRIAIVDDAHTLGGAQIALGRGVQALLKNTEIHIAMLTTSATVGLMRSIIGEDDRIKYYECPPAFPLNLIFSPLRLVQFWRCIKKVEHDGYVNWLLNLSGIEFCLSALMVLRFRKRKVIAWLHNPQKFQILQKDSRGFKKNVHRTRDALADYFVFERYEEIFSPSIGTAELVRDRLPRYASTRLSVLYPTVNINATSACKAQPRYGWDVFRNETINICVIGRIEFGHKNQIAALAVTEELCRRGYRVSLKFIGDGPDMDRLRDAAAQVIFKADFTFSGWVNDPWAQIDHQSIILIPSLFEGMPLVAIEAMLRGFPIVTSPLPIFYEGVPVECIAAGFDRSSVADRVLSIYNLSGGHLEILYRPYLKKFSSEVFSAKLCAIAESCWQ